MNGMFLKALGLVAFCYILLRALSWILTSLLRITQGFGYWFEYTLLPHAWQIAIAAGVSYLVFTAATNRRGSF